MSNLKLLRLGLYENVCGPAEIEYIDQVCRDIYLHSKQHDDASILPPEETGNDNCDAEIPSSVSCSIDDSEPVRKLSAKTAAIACIPYIETPESVLSSIEMAAKIYASKHLQSPPNVDCRSSSREVLQKHSITRISAWRKATMEKLNQKLKLGNQALGLSC